MPAPELKKCYRFSQIRETVGRTLFGPLLRYGDISPDFKERFEPTAFDSLDFETLDLILNIQHTRGRIVARSNAGLTLTNSRAELSVRADVPETPIGSEALAMTAAGLLRGFSVEFQPVQAHLESGLLVIDRALILDLSLVDRPAYPASVAAVRAEPYTDQNFRHWY